MAIDFPAAPFDGEAFSAPNGVTYRWDAAPGVWVVIAQTPASTGSGPIVLQNSPVLTGSPQAPTPSVGSNDGSIVTTEWANQYFYAPLLAADGDGNMGGTDITPLLQPVVNALSANGGGKVNIALTGTGIYRMATLLLIPSNVVIEAASGVKLDHRGVVGTGCWQFLGSAGPEINTAAIITRGDSVVTTTTPHGIPIVGDTYPALPADPDELWLLRGQRNALSADAGPWRLGVGTDGLLFTYYTEWLPVALVLSPTSFQSAVAVEFPDYNITPDPDPNSRPRTTVQRVSPCKNSQWIGGTVLADDALNTTALSSSLYAYNCQTKNVVMQRGTAGDAGTNARSISWSLSYKCEGYNVRVLRTPKASWNWLVDHQTRNDFVVSASQDCGFTKCYGEYGAQVVDFTYVGSTCCIRPYAVECVFERVYEGATSHPGVYQERWEKNEFRNTYYEGIMARGLQPKITGNIFASQTELKRGVIVSGSNKTINSISQANPAVVGVTAHGYIPGNTVYITSPTSMTEVDKKYYFVTSVVDVDNFIIDANSSGFGAYVSGGVVARANASRGVNLYNGYACGAVIAGNKFTGFRHAVAVVDGSGSTDEFTSVDAFITNNDIDECYNGLLTLFGGSAATRTSQRRIYYKDNHHRRMQRSVAQLSRYSLGVEIAGNSLHGDFIDAAADGDAAFLRIPYGDCPAFDLSSNRWRTDAVTANMYASVAGLTAPGGVWDSSYAGRSIATQNNIDPKPATTMFKINNNPIAQMGTYPDMLIKNWFGGSGATLLATAGTEYVSFNGVFVPQATQANARCVYIHRRMRITRVRIGLTVAPGAGTSRIFTLVRGSTPTAMVATVSNTSTFADVDFNGAGFANQEADVAAGNYLTMSSTVTGTPAATQAIINVEYCFC